MAGRRRISRSFAEFILSLRRAQNDIREFPDGHQLVGNYIYSLSINVDLSARCPLPTAHATSVCAKFLDFVNLLFYYVKTDIKKPFFEFSWLILDLFLEDFNDSAH
jgi:hypothetical protein